MRLHCAGSPGSRRMSNTTYELQKFCAESYFETQPQPPSLVADIKGVHEFTQRQRQANLSVVLVTVLASCSANHHAGTRDAISAEYFLKAGYGVIFVHRQFSLQPFSRRLVYAQGTLLMVSFVTMNEYLWLPHAVSRAMSVSGRKVTYHLATAVSDFFLPQQRLSEHWIQSRKGNLSTEMDQVPKILKPLVSERNPEGFIVFFKLEIDETNVIPKAQQALERYGHQVVIGNDLHHRKYRAVLTSPMAKANATKKLDDVVVSQPKYAEFWIEIDFHQPSNHPKEIDEDSVAIA
ncbi:phosphopantothenate-cysteine ligase [Suillus fuscotomentosus]|uniref:Phosphopantothenate-cysteine ligase n=1 Tax=Suillus fuscotomentosus TaxID=1912939 RepID=A0AAD4HLC0_9AGAM|nr:phosphopantothenate-cysteine ligase [Suillus fuscotomentosus]KAG1901905.1 phosphopantothenate-cysteine ligase [Suillus fuscotomentosus]